MRKRPGTSSSTPESEMASLPDPATGTRSGPREISARRSGFVWAVIFGVLAYSSWAVYHYQFESLPAPLTADQAGKRGFSEVEALKHVKALTDFGPHPVGSEVLDLALQELDEEWKTALILYFLM